MKPETWALLDEYFSESPILRAQSVPKRMVDELSATLGRPLPEDFAEFIRRYGGAIVGAYRVYGLRTCEPMGSQDTVLAQTERARKTGWLGAQDWVIFSMDAAGSPIGLAGDGTVQLWDHDASEAIQLASSFEEFLRRDCLNK